MSVIGYKVKNMLPCKVNTWKGYVSQLIPYCNYYLVPLLIYKMLLSRYEEDIKQTMSESTNHKNVFGDFGRHNMKSLKGWANYF